MTDSEAFDALIQMHAHVMHCAEPGRSWWTVMVDLGDQKVAVHERDESLNEAVAKAHREWLRLTAGKAVA